MLLHACAWAAIFIGVTAVGFEAAVELLLRYPNAVPSLFRPAQLVSPLKNYYVRFDREVVQLRSACAQYDEVMSYRLKPGACVVHNRESTVEYRVNRAGLRDTDDNVVNPQVVVLGDSHAMGWGVANEATTPRRLAALTGRKVLNAAISSYETVRELMVLREVISPATQYVVIAYCDNDYNPNWSFTSGGSVPTLPRAHYERLVATNERTSPYFPFKHVWYLVQTAVSPAPAAPSPAYLPKPGFAAMVFLAILDQSRDLLRGKHVIVVEVNGFNQNDSRFTTALRLAAAHSDLLGEVGSMHVVDASTFLTDDDYYLIDDHMHPGGHAKLARVLADIINGDTRWRVDKSANTPHAGKRPGQR